MRAIVVGKDKNKKNVIHKNAKTVKRNEVKKGSLKETFDDYLKGTAVDPDFDPNLDLHVAQQLSDVEENQEDENNKSTNISDLVDELVANNTDFNAERDEERAQILLEESLQKLRPKHFKVKSTKHRIGYFFLAFTLFLIGILIGQYYETSSRNTVYVLDEAKFLKLASVGIATSDQDKGTSELSEGDKKKVKDLISEVNNILSREYSRYPVLIQKRDNQSYEVYNLARRIDITVPVLIELIGEEKWSEIGKILK